MKCHYLLSSDLFSIIFLLSVHRLVSGFHRLISDFHRYLILISDFHSVPALYMPIELYHKTYHNVQFFFVRAVLAFLRKNMLIIFKCILFFLVFLHVYIRWVRVLASLEKNISERILEIKSVGLSFTKM